MPKMREVLETAAKSIKSAFISTPHSPDNWVSFRIDGRKAKEEEAGILDKENHAVFIGKYIPTSVATRIRRLLWPKAEDKEPIYNEEFIKGALAYAFAKTKPGERTVFVVCRVLSELFNREEDVALALSTEEEIKLIYEIAQRTFKKGKESLEVIDLEDMEEHADLFKMMRLALEDSDSAEVSIVQPLTKNLSSLEISLLLFRAQQESPDLRKALWHTMPERLRRGIEEGDEIPLRQHYGLCEIAIRLAEILRGRWIHGGVDRQEKYDQIIRKIIAGKFRESSTLQQLSAAFKESHFGTLHVSEECNAYSKKVKRNRARMRRAFYGTLASIGLTAAYHTGRMQEQEQEAAFQEKIKEDVMQELESVHMISGGGPWAQVSSPERKYQIFESVLEQMKLQLNARYQISLEAMQGLTPYLRRCLLQQKSSIDDLDTNSLELFDVVDQFVKEYKTEILETTKGNFFERPYQELEPYAETLKAAAKLTPEESTQEIDVKDAHGEWKSIGEFMPGRFTTYSLYTHQEDPGKVPKLFALQEVRREGRIQKIFWAAKGREAALEWLYMKKRYDLLELIPHFYLIHKLNDQNNPKDFSVDESRVTKTGAYKDFEGKFKFEVGIYKEYDEKVRLSTDHLVARHPGELVYTTRRAQEVAIQFWPIYGRDYPSSFQGEIEELKKTLSNSSQKSAAACLPTQDCEFESP